MMMHKALNLRDDIDYVSKKAGEKGHVSIEDSMDSSIRGLEDYIKKKSKKRLITATRNTTDSIMIDKTTRKQKWEEKQLYGYFK